MPDFMPELEFSKFYFNILNNLTFQLTFKRHCHGLTCAETFTLEDSRGHVFLSAAIMESSVSV